MYFMQGFLLLIGLIISIGPQNLFVLRQGISKQHGYSVAAVSALCDILIILGGIAGLSQFISTHPTIMLFIVLFGLSFLYVYGIHTIEIMKVGSELMLEHTPVKRELRNSIKMALGFSLLNPLTWIETVGVIGMQAVSLTGKSQQMFVAGAMMASVTWFFGLIVAGNKIADMLRNQPAKLTAMIDSIKIGSLVIVIFIVVNLTEKLMNISATFPLWVSQLSITYLIGLISYSIYKFRRDTHQRIKSKLMAIIKRQCVEQLHELVMGYSLDDRTLLSDNGWHCGSTLYLEQTEAKVFWHEWIKLIESCSEIEYNMLLNHASAIGDTEMIYLLKKTPIH